MFEDSKRFSVNQLGGLITIAVVAAWSMWVGWLHFTKPLGMDFSELLFLSALAPVCLLLLPFYVLRVRWSYINGMLVFAGLLLWFAKSILENSFFFSATAYNLTVVAILLTSLTGVFFSLRSYLELPLIGGAQTILGIGGLLAVSVIATWLVSTNQAEVENYQLQQVIRGVQSRNGEIDALDEKIEALMAEGDINTLVTAMVVNDEIALIKEYGGGGNVEKMFDSGSITKTFIATAVLQLYERGLIGLDDNVNDYLPFEVRHPVYPQIPITIRMLLTNKSCLAHKSGLYDTYLMGEALREWGMEHRDWEFAPELEEFPYTDFMSEYLVPGGAYFELENWENCEPGRGYAYSTSGFDLLGLIVEAASGQPLNDYLAENVFIPMGMENTTATPLDQPEKIAIPYERWYGLLSKTNLELPLNQRLRLGGGGLYTTAEDLAKYLLAHMNQGEYAVYQLLRPDTSDLMHSLVSQTFDDFMQVGYGYGWGRYQEEPRQMWDITYQPHGFQGHAGRYWGYSAAMYMVEEEEGAYGYVLLMNNSMVESMDIPWALAIQMNIQDLLLGEAHRLYKETLRE